MKQTLNSSKKNSFKTKSTNPYLVQFNKKEYHLIVMKFVGVCEVSADRLVASMKMI